MSNSSALEKCMFIRSSVVLFLLREREVEKEKLRIREGERVSEWEWDDSPLNTQRA